MLLVDRLKHSFHAQWLERHRPMLQVDLLSVENFLRQAICNIARNVLRAISGYILAVTGEQVLI